MKKQGKHAGLIFQITLVLLCTLLLVVYVGFGEAYRTYPRLRVEGVKALSEILKNSLESFLNAGLPLKQYIGFESISNPIISSDDSIYQIDVQDNNNNVIFTIIKKGAGGGQAANKKFVVSKLMKKGDDFEILETKKHYMLSIPLYSKFEKEPAGKLNVTILRSEINNRINPRFNFVFISLPIVLILFILLLSLTIKSPKKKIFINIFYSLSFMSVTFFVIIILITIYSDGIKGKSEALAKSLGQRLNTALELKLELDDFSELDKTFDEYKVLNPEISYIALTKDSIVQIHTSKTELNTTYQYSNEYFENTINLKDKSSLFLQHGVHIGILKKIIYKKLFRNIKNFFVLFIATGFLAALFLNLIVSINHKQNVSKESEGYADTVSQANTNLIRPLFFLGVFIEGLFVSFLPQYFQEITIQSNLNPDIISFLFTSFFLFYGLIIIPGGKFAEKAGVKSLLTGSILLITLSVLLMIIVKDFYLMLALRALAGIGQGALLIGTQYYILQHAHAAKKTQGHSIIVVEYCGGRLSGIALGALMVNYVDISGVFVIGSTIAVALIVYSMFVIPKTHVPILKTADQEKKVPFFQELKIVFKDLDFIKTSFLIGITAKSIVSGVIVFGLPLLMAGKNFYKEDIGQILIFYNAGVLIASIYASKVVDKTGNTKSILFLATIGSTIGLVLIGLLDRLEQFVPINILLFSSILLIFGIFVLGISHGFINAPVITHISHTKTAKTLGKTSISLYRSLERIGQVIGPIVVSQLLIFTARNTITYFMIGMAILVFGVIYVIGKRQKV